MKRSLIDCLVPIFFVVLLGTLSIKEYREYKKAFPELPAYPGTKRMSICAQLWEDRYNDTLDVKKCEAKVDHPKYKVGTRVVTPERLNEDNCKSYITGTYFWNPIKNEQEYFVKSTCPLGNNQTFHSDDFVIESKIKVRR